MMTAKTKFSSANGDGVYFGLEKYCIYPAHSGANMLLERDKGQLISECLLGVIDFPKIQRKI